MGPNYVLCVFIHGNLKTVQRYNSLAVFNDDNIEIETLTLDNGVTYQFHPESVGTIDMTKRTINLMKW